MRRTRRGNSVLTPKAAPLVRTGRCYGSRACRTGASGRAPCNAAANGGDARVDSGHRRAVEGVMATRLTYTSGTRTPELDAAFERCLEAARADAHDPLPHVVGGSERTDG